MNYPKKVVHDYYGPGKIDFIKMREALQNIEYKILNNGNTSDDVSFKKIYLKKVKRYLLVLNETII